MRERRAGNQPSSCPRCGRHHEHRSGRLNCEARERFETEWEPITREAFRQRTVDGIEPVFHDDDSNAHWKRDDARLALADLLDQMNGASGKVEVVSDLTKATAAEGIIEAVGWYGSVDDAIDRDTGFSTTGYSGTIPLVVCH